MQGIDEELEKKEILKRYRRLLRHVKPYLKGTDAKQIKKAILRTQSTLCGEECHRYENEADSELT